MLKRESKIENLTQATSTMEQLRENTYLRRCIVRMYEKGPGKIAEERSAMHPVKIFILFQSGVGTHTKKIAGLNRQNATEHRQYVQKDLDCFSR